MVESGSEWLMDTGEKVRVGATWGGERETRVFVTLIEQHTFRGKFTNDNGEEHATLMGLPRGSIYSLTPAELARNGKRIDAVERIAA